MPEYRLYHGLSVFRRVIHIKFRFFLLLLFLSIILSACESPETTEIIPLEETKPLELVSNQNCDYTVIRSDYSNGPDVKAAILLCNTFEERTGLRPRITTDWEDNPETEHEIIIGETLREKTEGFKIDRDALGKNGFIIKVLGEKIFITGGSDEATYTAVEYFLETFVKQNSTEVVVDRKYEYTVYQEFDIRSFYICGRNYIDFTILFDSPSLKQAAELLSDTLSDKTGKRIAIKESDTDSAAEPYILLTSKKPETDGIHLVRAVNGNLVFSSSGKGSGVMDCVARFISQYLIHASGNCRISEGFIYSVTSDYIIIKDPRV